jgi:hypothetical protein
VGDCVRGFEASAWQGVGTAKRHPSGSSTDLIAKPTAESTTAALSARAILLFCLASDTDRRAASITHATAQQMIVGGLIERDQVASS